MKEYNKHIIKKFYVPDYRKLLHRPLHRIPVYYKMKETLETTHMQLEIVSIYLNETYQLLVQIAINIKIEIKQLKKIKDMILNRKDKSLITLILIKLKDKNNWTLKRFYTEKPKAKEDELLPSRYYWPDTDPEIDYDYMIKK